MRYLVPAILLAAIGCQRTGEPAPATQTAQTAASAPLPIPHLRHQDERMLTQAAPAAPATGDPAKADVPLEEAVKGLKGKGALLAKLEIEGAGTKGVITCELFEDKAPRSVSNFVGLARGLRPWKDPKTGQWVKRPLYDGTVFHRVIPEFMIQGGDPTGTGSGSPGYEFPDEIREDLKFDKGGSLGMANHGRHTNGSQFFITEKETSWLNGRYIVFGQCDNVMFVKKLARVPTRPPNRPEVDLVLKKVTILRGPSIVTSRPKKEA